MQNVWAFLKSDGGRAVTAFLAIGVSITIYRLNRKRKSLTYDILSMTRLIGIGKNEISERVKIVVDDKPVQNVGIVRVKITNSGTEPIKASDFERKITFAVWAPCRVIDASVTEKKPDSLQPSVWFEDDKVTIEKTLLNSRDSITLKIILADFDGDVLVDARIEGAELKRPAFAKKGSLLQIIASNVSGIAMVTGSIALCIVVLQLLHILTLSRFALLGTTGAIVLFTMLVVIFSSFIRLEDGYPNDYAEKR
jgi:hypothetical protein